MPPIFKALTTIGVWILFVTGCMAILTSFPFPFFTSGKSWELLAVGVVSITLSAVTAIIRKTLG